jgi:glycosyltransferase involved in cell wall biosynthesis
MRLTLRRVDSVGVMGSSLRWVFDGLVPPERIVVVANGTPEPASNGIVRDPEHVLFLSNLRQRKGVSQAVDAALLVLDRRPSARFTFAGEWESEELERELRARAARASGSIVFKPPVQGAEKDKLLASSSVLLFPPAEPEGHPRVVLEALAAGVPVVTTDRGAIRETVVNGETGYVLPEPEPRVLADRVLELLGDPELHQRMRASARTRHSHYFTQEIADRNLNSWLVRLSVPRRLDP